MRQPHPSLPAPAKCRFDLAPPSALGMWHDRRHRLHARQPLCLDPADHLAGARRGGRHRPVARGRRAADHPGRVRGGPRRRLASPIPPPSSASPSAASSWARWPTGSASSCRSSIAGVSLGAGLLPRRPVAELLAVRRRAGGAHRLPRQCRHLRAAGGRYLAMVPQAPRHRDCHRGERQLHRRHHLAALHAGGDRELWLAHHLHGDRPDLRRGHGAARAVPEEAPAFRRHGKPGQPHGGPARACCPSIRCCFPPSCWRACPAVSPCRCRRSTSSPIAPTWAMARRAARRCCPSCWASAC